MADTRFLGHLIQVAHNFLYMFLCLFIFNTFKIKKYEMKSQSKLRMDLDSLSNNMNEQLTDDEK